ncbi:unnamed protein product [Lampetra fluviatilis]
MDPKGRNVGVETRTPRALVGPRPSLAPQDARSHESHAAPQRHRPVQPNNLHQRSPQRLATARRLYICCHECAANGDASAPAAPAGVKGRDDDPAPAGVKGRDDATAPAGVKGRDDATAPAGVKGRVDGGPSPRSPSPEPAGRRSREGRSRCHDDHDHDDDDDEVEDEEEEEEAVAAATVAAATSVRGGAEDDDDDEGEEEEEVEEADEESAFGCHGCHRDFDSLEQLVEHRASECLEGEEPGGGGRGGGCAPSLARGRLAWRSGGLELRPR